MDAIGILNKCRDAPEAIRRTEQRIWQRRRFLDGARGSPESLAAEIGALEQRLKGQRERLAVETAAACALLDLLPGKESAVLYAYYIDGLSAAGVARRLRYSEGYVRRLRRQGEERLRRIPEDGVAAQLPAWYRKETEYGES